MTTMAMPVNTCVCVCICFISIFTNTFNLILLFYFMHVLHIIYFMSVSPLFIIFKHTHSYTFTCMYDSVLLHLKNQPTTRQGEIVKNCQSFLIPTCACGRL